MFVYTGDSWALKGFTKKNYNIGNRLPMPEDKRMADYWNEPYTGCFAPGNGNLSVLDKLVTMNLPSNVPIIWIYTEPGRDYRRITGKPEFDWIESEDIFSIRKDLDYKIIKTISEKLSNPISFIGGLSDVDVNLLQNFGFSCLHNSWQQWIAERLDRTDYFKFGWGASDVGWRADYNNVKPSKTALFAWDELIKEWCMWDELGFMCHEHPTPMANKLFAEHLEHAVSIWIKSVKK